MIKLSENAVQEVRNVMEEQGLNMDDHFLRVGVRGGGCSGFTYTLDVVKEKTENDEEFDNDGIKVICDSRSQLYVEGTEIDFKSDLMQSGFVFKNPNATSTCGCNKSFSA